VPSAWAQVWQSVWDGLNLDLDFPWADEQENTTQRTEAQQRELAEWHRRFRIAERQGAAARFRNTTTSLLQRNRQSSPKPESQEELSAWNAFEKAKDLQSENLPEGGRNKRKSISVSPAEPKPEPERKLKRPKTRRTENLGESSSDGGIPFTKKASSPVSQRIKRQSLTSLHTDTRLTGPSFFQSLLKEVENAPAISELDEQQYSPVDQATPTSPNLSTSAGSSPLVAGQILIGGRSPSPPPLQLSSPPSPPPLSSCIEPVFAKRPGSPIQRYVFACYSFVHHYHIFYSLPLIAAENPHSNDKAPLVMEKHQSVD